MTDFNLSASQGLPIATAATVLSLMNHLIANGIIQPLDARNILKNAEKSLEAKANITSSADALRIIHEWLPRFKDSKKVEGGRED